MKKYIWIVIIFFLGYFSSYLVGRYKLHGVDPATYFDTAKVVPQEGVADTFISYVDFDGEDFSPKRVVMKKGDYLAITNKSEEKLMWLLSKYRDLSTPRGYGQGEQLRVSISEQGEILVANKEKLSRVLTIIVK